MQFPRIRRNFSNFREFRDFSRCSPRIYREFRAFLPRKIYIPTHDQIDGYLIEKLEYQGQNQSIHPPELYPEEN